MDHKSKSDLRTAERHPYEANVEFMVDADIIKSKSIDISDKGIRLETEKAVSIYMKIKSKNEEKNYHAELVWARRKDNGRMEYGFEYIPDSQQTSF